jgi:AcrR family transcriptional regulator
VESSRKRIHAAALNLLARYGYEGVTLQMIANAVGLHKSSLFHYYRGKLELAREVFEAALERVADHVRPLPDDDPPSFECLFGVVDALVDHFSDEPDVARLILMVTIAPRDSDLNIPIDADSDLPGIERFRILWEWLERARKKGVIRSSNLPQTIFNLVGVVLYYPAVAKELGPISGPSPSRRRLGGSASRSCMCCCAACSSRAERGHAGGDRHSLVAPTRHGCAGALPVGSALDRNRRAARRGRLDPAGLACVRARRGRAARPVRRPGSVDARRGPGRRVGTRRARSGR